MVAANITSKDKELDENNVFKAKDKLSLLKSAAIYGANASGKSNLIKALAFMRSFVLNSARETQVTDKISIETFRLGSTDANKPAFFEIVFLIEGKQYRYGFKVTTEKVIEEWLYYVPTIREATLFTRDSASIHPAKAFKEGHGIEGRTRDNALFLSVVAQFNGEVAKEILGWFQNLEIVSDLTYINYNRTTEMLYDDNSREAVVQLLREFDLGLDDIIVEKTVIDSESPLERTQNIMRISSLGNFNMILPRKDKDNRIETLTVKTIHRKFGDNGEAFEAFNIKEHESEGTRKIFALVAPILDSLKNGRTLIIDELDARLHPLLTHKILEIFNSNQTNSHKAQLIFTTHDTNLLNNKLFRRDQIWFTQKNRYSATQLFSLVEYKVRNDASFEKDYIQGKYGAIPFIGNIDQIFSETNG